MNCRIRQEAHQGCQYYFDKVCYHRFSSFPNGRISGLCCSVYNAVLQQLLYNVKLNYCYNHQ